MKTYSKPYRLFYTIISMVILSSFLVSNDEKYQLRQVDADEKNLLKLFAKENAKMKKKKIEVKTPQSKEVNLSK